MANYTAGSVTAEITLNTKQFDQAITDLKNKVRELKGEFKSNKSVDNLSKEVEELKAKVESLTKINDDYRKKLNDLRKGHDEVTSSVEKNRKALEEQRKAWAEMSESMKNSSNSAADNKKRIEENIATVKKHNAELKETLALAKETNRLPSGRKYYHGGNPADGKAADILGYESAMESAKQLATQVRALGEEMAAFSGESAKNAEIIAEIKLEYESLVTNMVELALGLDKGLISVEQYAEGLVILEEEFNKISTKFTTTAEEAIKAAEALKKVEQATTKYDRLASEIERLKNQISAMSEISTQGGQALSADARYATTLGNQLNSLNLKFESGKITIDQYVSGLLKIEGQLSKLHTEVQITTNEINQGNVGLEKTKPLMDQVSNGVRGLNASLEKTGSIMDIVQVKLDGFTNKAVRAVTSLDVGARSNELYSEVSRISQIINHFSEISTKNKQALAGLGEQAAILKDKISVLDSAFREGEITAETYDAELTKIVEKLKLLGTATRDTVKGLSEQTRNVREAGRGLTSFNNGIVQTAHSGRILSNTLYQIRGALLSLKMIFTAMGGMMLWGFAMDLAEGVKSTFTAKNELEAQLNANAKIGASGINTFNKALDDTISKFQKINKYSLGETVSSIGLEFELSAKQMEKAMPIVAMIQSEYVRAGRTSEEAALAVKDILQGEFQRLSRETGVGKEELIAYGWDEDKTNIDGLLAALEKAAKDRNWDLFAAKATSLNDVVEITKSRFSEFGADLLQSVSPAIVGAFNTIIDALSWLQGSFESLGSFWQNFALIGGGGAAFAGILTALPMITKGMGLAEIATMGWGKSVLTATLNLNKMEVAQYGVRKALAAVITGTQASDLATRSATKAILGRVMGVNQAVQAENGLIGAMVHSKMTLKGVTLDTNAAAVVTGNLRQKLIYLSSGVMVADKQSATWGKTIKSLVTSIKLWRTVLLSLMAVNVAVWLAGVAMWTDAVKKNVDGFNNVVDNGEDIINDAKTSYDAATAALETNQKKLNENAGDEATYNRLLWERNQLLKNQEVAQNNIYNAQKANEEAQAKSKELKNKQTQIELDHQNQLAEAYKQAGNNNKDAELLAYNLMSEVNVGYYYRNKALDEYNRHLEAGVKHSAENAKQMHEAGQDQEKINRYMEDYNAATLEVAENWKKFNEGDFMAGAYALLAQLKQQWIDFANTEWFDKLQDGLNRLWTWLAPKVDVLIGWLKELAKWGINAFSWLTTTDFGNTVLTLGGLGVVVGALALKFKGWIGAIKDSFGTLIDWGKKLRDRKKDVEDLGNKTEEVDKKTGGGVTGKSKGKTGGYEKWDWKTLKQDIGKDAMTEARKFAKIATQIALAMGVIAVAITSLIAPLLALAAVGVVYKGVEQQAKDGIEGLKFVAPVVAAFLVPVLAIMYVMDKVGGTLSENITHTAVQSAKAIAVGMLLVAEAVLLMVAPMAAIAAVGFVKGILGDSVEKGKEAIELVTETLVGLYPIIPVFAAAILAGSIAIDTVGVGALYMVGSLAIGMGLVAVAVVTLSEPLLAIGALGAIFTDLTAVKRGADAIKTCAEALTYLTEALGLMVMVDFELLADYVLKLIGTNIGFDVKLTDLTKEGGFFTEIRDFVSAFNKIDIEPVNDDKVTALSGISDGLRAITDAMKNANDAINNIPPELKDPKTALSYDMETNTTQVKTEDMTGYFDQLKEPLRQLKQFVDDFNNSEEFNFQIGEDWQSRVDAINSAATMLEQVNTAVERVKTVMGNVGGAQWNTAYAEGGIFGAAGNWLYHATGLDSINNGQGSGDYKSSLGSSLKQMEDIITDLFTFQNNVSTITAGASGEGADVEGVTSMVTTIQTAISTLSQSLTDAVPQFEGNGNAIGAAVSKGIKDGIGNLREVIVPPLIEAMNEAKNQAGTYGKGIGWRGTEGFKAEFKIKEAVEGELSAALQYMEDKKPEFHDKGYELGAASAQGYKEGADIHSPGIMARALFGEIDYMTGALDEAIMNMPNQTSALAETMATQFTPSFNLGLIDATDLTLFSQGLGEVTSMANTADIQTSLAFADMNASVATNMTGMTMSVNGAFNTIQANATTSYAQITNTTRTSLSNMQSQTTKNINAIKSSWIGMQNALIASAENIRAETGAKINALESNMASFWNKVQNPSLLLASGSNDGTNRSRNRPSMRTGVTKSSFSRSLARRGAAGSRPKTGSKVTGIPDSIRPRTPNVKGKPSLFDNLKEYLACLLNGGICAAGGGIGWNFNWADDIKQALLQWHTHFGEIYDPYLYVGKFDGDDFPVRGIADIAKGYIYDAISRTSYSYYYDHHYGSAKEAYDAGAFNCVDGAMVAIGFADKFGFPGGVIRYGTWDGEGHGFADIPGLGIIDATAIQKGYGFTSPKVSGYGSSSLISNSAKKAASGSGQTHNYNGDINLNINVYGDDVEVNENKVDKKTARSIIDLLGINPHTGL